MDFANILMFFYVSGHPEYSESLTVVFHCFSHNLPIEKGRFLHLQRNLRVFEICTDSQKLGDEFYCIFKCPTFSVDRS